jgi:hypothetical protein
VAQELTVAKKAKLLFGQQCIEWFTFTIAMITLGPILNWLTEDGLDLSSLTNDIIKVAWSVLDGFHVMPVFEFFKATRDL